jgi:hypothetical protein
MASVIRGSDNFDSEAGSALKAWVNFNGTGTVAIRAAYNVSSITDNGVGDYTANFTTAISDANYSICTNASFDGGGFTGQQNSQPKADSTPLASSCRIASSNSSNAALNDATKVYVAIFR